MIELIREKVFELLDQFLYEHNCPSDIEKIIHNMFTSEYIKERDNQLQELFRKIYKRARSMYNGEDLEDENTYEIEKIAKLISTGNVKCTINTNYVDLITFEVKKYGQIHGTSLISAYDLLLFPNRMHFYVDVEKEKLLVRAIAEGIVYTKFNEFIRKNNLRGRDLLYISNIIQKNQKIILTIVDFIKNHKCDLISNYIDYTLIYTMLAAHTSEYFTENQAVVHYGEFIKIHESFPEATKTEFTLYYSKILKLKGHYPLSKLIKPKSMSLTDYINYVEVLTTAHTISKAYNYLVPEITFDDYKLYDENNLEMILNIVFKYDFMNLNYYQKINKLPIPLQWKFIVDEHFSVPQSFENVSPLYLGGKHNFNRFAQIYLLSKGNGIIEEDLDYYFDHFTRFSLAFTDIFFKKYRPLLKQIQSCCDDVIDKFADIVKVIITNIDSSDVTREAINKVYSEIDIFVKFYLRYFHDNMNYYNRQIFNQIGTYYSEFKKFPKTKKELATYLYNLLYKDVDPDLVDHILKTNVSYVSELSKVWKKHKSKKRKLNLPIFELTKDDYKFRILDKSDPLQLFVGEYTNCCQTLDNAAESCVRYGLSKKNSGFCVIEKDDLVQIQSWFWIKDNIMVFDSFEAEGRKFPDTIIDLIKDAFNYILDNTKITEIRIGDCDYGITKFILSKIDCEYVKAIKLDDYKGYSDARIQVKYKG